MVQETHLNASDFVLPVFIKEGTQVREPISSMPGLFRLSLDELLKDLKEWTFLGLHGLALFPSISDSLKSPDGQECLNP